MTRRPRSLKFGCIGTKPLESSKVTALLRMTTRSQRHLLSSGLATRNGKVRALYLLWILNVNNLRGVVEAVVFTWSRSVQVYVASCRCRMATLSEGVSLCLIYAGLKLHVQCDLLKMLSTSELQFVSTTNCSFYETACRLHASSDVVSEETSRWGLWRSIWRRW